MVKTLKTLLILERSNKTNLYSLVVVIALIIGMGFIASQGSYKNPLADATAEYQSTSSAMSKYQIVDVSSIDNSDTMFGYLTRLRQAIALELAALKTGKEEMLEVAINRTLTLREDIYKKEDFYKVQEFIPPKIQNDNERVFVEKLKETGLSFQQEIMEFWPFLLAIFSTIGIAWYPFVSFYTSNIMIQDFQHSTVIRGYPVRFDYYVIAKSVTKLMLIVTFIALIFILCIPLIPWKGLGASNYPVIIFTGSSVAVTIPQYIVLCIVYMIVIAVFTLLLSIALNMLVKNMYITFFIHMILYFLPITFPSLISIIPLNPFNFLNFNFILEGGALTLLQPKNLSFIHSFIILIICIALLLLFVQRYLSIRDIKRV